MKKNKIIVIISIFLAIAAMMLVVTQSDKTFKRSLSDFEIEDTAAVTKIFMADKNNHTVELTRQPSGNWMVNNTWKASKNSIDLILQTMHNLTVKEPVPRPAYNNVIRDLAVNSVKVEIYQKVYRINLFNRIRWFPHEKLTKVYYIGGATQSNRGNFSLMEGSSVPFITWLPGFRGFVSPRFQPIPKYWRDYTVFKKNLPEIATVLVEFPTKKNESFQMTNQGNILISLSTYPEKQVIPDFDTLAALNFLTAFRNLNFEAILDDFNPHRKDSILSSLPLIIITLTDTSGSTTLMKAFFKEGDGQTDINGDVIPYDLDRLYALVNNGEDFVLIQYFNFDRVLRPRSFFLLER